MDKQNLVGQTVQFTDGDTTETGKLLEVTSYADGRERAVIRVPEQGVFLVDADTIIE